MFKDTPGRTKRISISIDTGDAALVHMPPYRLPKARHMVVQEEIRQMLTEGLIEPSFSPWASPIVLVPNKDGSLRVCIDYRKLNGVTRPDPYPIPRVDDLIDGLSQAGSSPRWI